jgi:hypothetical protein
LAAIFVSLQGAFGSPCQLAEPQKHVLTELRLDRGPLSSWDTRRWFILNAASSQFPGIENEPALRTWFEEFLPKAPPPDMWMTSTKAAGTLMIDVRHPLNRTKDHKFTGYVMRPDAHIDIRGTGVGRVTKTDRALDITMLAMGDPSRIGEMLESALCRWQARAGGLDEPVVVGETSLLQSKDGSGSIHVDRTTGRLLRTQDVVGEFKHQTVYFYNVSAGRGHSISFVNVASQNGTPTAITVTLIDNMQSDAVEGTIDLSKLAERYIDDQTGRELDENLQEKSTTVDAARNQTKPRATKPTPGVPIERVRHPDRAWGSAWIGIPGVSLIVLGAAFMWRARLRRMSQAL